MCGIAGVVGFGASTEAPLVASMTQVLAHRGPDDSGLFSERDAALGHRRLSIIDLSRSGRQPMLGRDDRYVVVYNGEIYNYLELRTELASRGHVFRTKTDTEVLLAAYVEWGESCVHRFIGMWAFAIWDRVARSLFASRDRFGKKPFYYVQRGSRLYFASEMKALFLVPGLARSLNTGAALAFCADRVVDHGAETLISEIAQLPPAHSLTWRDGRLQVSGYWELVIDAFDDVEPGEALRDIADCLSDAVRLRLRADARLGCLASGGLDSSVIAALMRRQSSSAEPIHVFSTVTDPPCEEASRLIHVIGAPGFETHVHTPTARSFWDDLPRLLWHQEQPFADGSMAAHYALMRLAREHGVTVLLTGQGADEIFAGYDTYLWVHAASLVRQGRWREAASFANGLRQRGSLRIDRIAAHALPAAVRSGARRLRARRRLRWVNPDLLRLASVSPPQDANLDSYQRYCIDVATLPGFLRYEDRNSMAFGVETRLPYLDHRVAEKVFRLSASERLRRGRTKSLLREVARPLVSPDIVNQRRKQPYPAPLGAWLRALAPAVDEMARSATVRECPVLNHPVWLSEWERYRAGRSDRLEPVWRGLITALWYEQVFKMPASQLAAMQARPPAPVLLPGSSGR